LVHGANIEGHAKEENLKENPEGIIMTMYMIDYIHSLEGWVSYLPWLMGPVLCSGPSPQVKLHLDAIVHPAHGFQSPNSGGTMRTDLPPVPMDPMGLGPEFNMEVTDFGLRARFVYLF